MEVVLLAACCVGAFEASVLWKDGYVPNGATYVAVGRDTAYIATEGYQEVYVVDVSDPAAPGAGLVGVMEMSRGIGAMQASNSLLYVVYVGLTIYDGSGEVVGRWEPPNPSSTPLGLIEVVGTTVYLVGYYVYVVDAADPTAPILMCSSELGQRTPRSLTVSGSTAYICSSGGYNGVMAMQAAHNDSTCIFMGESWTPVAHSMAVSDGFLYLGTLNSVEIYEAEDIILAGSYPFPSDQKDNTATNLLLSDSMLYVTLDTPHDQLTILNVSVPSSPSLVGSYDVPPFTATALVGTTLFGVCGGDEITPILEMIDVSTPEAPKVIGGFGTSQSADSAHATDTLAAVCYKYGGTNHFMRLYDVSNPSAPTQLSDVHLNPPNKAFIHGTHVYVATDDGLTIVDITNPSAPFVASNTSSNGHPFLDVKVEGETAYVAVADSGLYIYNVSNPSAPKQVGYFNTTGIDTVAVAGTVAYIGTDTELLTVDVSSPASTKLLGSLQSNKGEDLPIYDMCVQGTVVYLACNKQFLIVDVSDPTDPTLLGDYKNTESSYYLFLSVSVVGDIAHVAEHNTGLHILDVKYPANPVLLDVVELGDQATSVHAVGTTVFVVDYGLRIVGTHTPTATPSATKTFTLTHTATDSVTPTTTNSLTDTVTATDSVTATVTLTHTDSVTETETMTEVVDGTGSSGVPVWVWVLVSVGVLGLGGVATVAVMRRRSPRRIRAATLFEDPECPGVTEGLVQGGGSQGFSLE